MENDKKITKRQAIIRIDELEDILCNLKTDTTLGKFHYEQYSEELDKMWQIVDGEI